MVWSSLPGRRQEVEGEACCQTFCVWRQLQWWRGKASMQKEVKKKSNYVCKNSALWDMQYQEYWIWMLIKILQIYVYKCIILLQDSGGKKGFKSSFWQENKKRARQVEVHMHAPAWCLTFQPLFTNILFSHFVWHVILHHPESWVSCEGTCWGSLCVWIRQYLRWSPGEEKEVRPTITKERHQGMSYSQIHGVYM